MTSYYFGEVPENPPGTTYANRQAAMAAGVHQVGMAGISGNKIDGANSIVVSGGYVDDEDHGDWLIYTGAGGRDPATGRQIMDQTLDHHNNAGLVVSEANGLPVRVLRGWKGDATHSPPSGFRYDGLFRVTDHWAEQGSDGFQIWRFRLEAMSQEECAPWLASGAAAVRVSQSVSVPTGSETASRRAGVVQRIVRNSRVTEFVKRIHDHRCQVCGLSVLGGLGTYAEGAHIRGLGRPHDGPDVPENVLCLCPNHHVQLDKGAIYIDDALVVRSHLGDLIGRLRTASGHTISIEHIAYHREHFGMNQLVVGAVIVDDLGSPTSVLVARRSDGAWEFPGGKVEAGESTQEALARELLEELSVRGTVAGEIVHPRGYLPISHGARLRLFRTAIGSDEPTLSSAHSEFRWVSIGDLTGLHWLPADAAAIPLVQEQLATTNG